MIRSWVESRVTGLWRRTNRVLEKRGFVSEVRERWVEALYVIAIVIMTAGTINAVLQPVNIGYVIYPASGYQSATETVVDAFAILLGAGGVYISYESGKQTTNPRLKNFDLVIGLVLIAIAIYIGIYVLSSK